jgi:L-fucose isomerase-like protein
MDECTQRMFNKYGVTLEERSFAKMGAEAKALPDTEAEKVWEVWGDHLPLGNISVKQRNSALKVYLKLKYALEADPSIKGMGINCLNESHHSDTTPCLAWNMLYEEEQLIWGCEGDTLAMLTKYLLHKSLDVPIMMTNMYPFLMGDAALKHERIPYFPEVKGNPDNYILAAHCGYLGVVPQSFATDWKVESKVLAIVDDNAIALDARLPEGPITLAKLHPTLETISVIEGEIEKYVQYEDSDCLNSAVIRVSDGHQLVSSLTSHHYLILTGHRLAEIRQIAKVFDFEVEAF